MPGKKNNFMPVSYSNQYGYGTQPMVNPMSYVDSKGNKLNHTFEEINKLFGASGDSLIGVNRTGIASGTNMSETLDSLVENIGFDRGFFGTIRQYVESNTKNIATMEYPSEDWVAGANTTISYTSSALVGNQSLKETVTTATSGYHSAKLQLSKSGGLDLSTFNDESESTNNDIIKYRFYVNNVSAIDTSSYAGVALYFSNGSAFSYATSDYMVHFITTGLVSGINSVELQKSDFIAVNSGTFSTAIQSIQCQFAVLAGNSGAWINFDDVTLSKVDPISADVGNPFQRNLNGVQTQDFQILSGDWYVGESEPGLPFCKNVQPSSTGADSTSVSLKSTVSYTDEWIASMTIKIGTNSYSNRLCWEVANDKRVSTYINTDLLCLSIKWEGTILAVKTTNFAVDLNDTITLQLQRQGSIFKAVATRNGNPSTLAQLNLDTRDFVDAFFVSQSMVINDSGYIGVGDQDGVAVAIYSIGISTTRLAIQAIDSFAVGGIPSYQIMSKVSTAYEYYINQTSGSDSYDGQSTTGAFKTLKRLRFEPPFGGGNFLAADCIVYLASGTYDEGIIVTGLAGAGTLYFYGQGVSSTIITGLDARAMVAALSVTGIEFSSNTTCIHCDRCQSVEFENIAALATAAGGGKYGARLYRGNYSFTNFNVNSANAGILANKNSMVYLESCVGSGNNYGCYATNNSTVGRTGTYISGTVDNFATAGAEIRT